MASCCNNKGNSDRFCDGVENKGMESQLNSDERGKSIMKGVIELGNPSQSKRDGNLCCCDASACAKTKGLSRKEDFSNSFKNFCKIEKGCCSRNRQNLECCNIIIKCDQKDKDAKCCNITVDCCSKDENEEQNCKLECCSKSSVGNINKCCHKVEKLPCQKECCLKSCCNEIGQSCFDCNCVISKRVVKCMNCCKKESCCSASKANCVCIEKKCFIQTEGCCKNCKLDCCSKSPEGCNSCQQGQKCQKECCLKPCCNKIGERCFNCVTSKRVTNCIKQNCCNKERCCVPKATCVCITKNCSIQCFCGKNTDCKKICDCDIPSKAEEELNDKKCHC